MEEIVVIVVDAPTWASLPDQAKRLVALACYQAYIKQLLDK